MTFSLDRIVGFVRIDEPDLISIHRSTRPIVPTDENCLGHMCDAFICAARENNACMVYVALYDTRQKSNLVFVADPVAPGECQALIRKAETFLNELGFSMEPVNVNFSPATREVILRDIKVMRPPKPVAQKRQPGACAPAQKGEETSPQVVAAAEQAHRPAVADAEREALLDARLTEAATALERLSAEKEELARKASREFKRLKAQRDRLKKELDAAATARLEAERAPPDEAGDSGIIAALEAERDALLVELAALREETETLRRALLDARTGLGRENDRLSREIDRLRDEREVAAVSLANEVEALRAALAIADENLASERAKVSSALREMEALERNAAAGLKALKKRVDSLGAEKELLESMAAEVKLKAKDEIERLQMVNQSQRRAAIKKVNALKDEMRQLAEARSIMASPFGLAMSPGGADPPLSGRAPEHPAPAPAQDRSDTGATPSDPFRSTEWNEGVSFEPDMTLKGVPYAEPGDVIEVHRSFNKIQAAPAGHPIQSCEGFVCLVRDGGGGMVYAAWLMNTTRKVLVCRPERIFANGDARRALRDGIDYFERVGFLMDRLDLEADPDQRRRQFDNLSIFTGSAMERAA